MHIIARPAIRSAMKRHPDAAEWLESWWLLASTQTWESLHAVRQVYVAADQVDCRLVFHARGNRYRLICRVTYANPWQGGTLLVKYILTHAE
jgi:mRNA-degrading endonuclease HigB of HigAB toxin-antitoxin module